METKNGTTKKVISTGNEVDPSIQWLSIHAQPPVPEATMPVERDADYYNMNHQHRGLALIFNHEKFENKDLKPRTGTNVDFKKLQSVLQDLDFEVWPYHNLTCEELMEAIDKAVNFDHTKNDCIIVCVLTHGEHGILYALDSAYKTESLWTAFTADKCPSLAGKPKMFFIQSCQGDKLDGGVMMMKSTETDSGSHSYKIPVYSDFLIAYSTIPGYFSWRNTSEGSWFIQALCKELEENGLVLDLLTLLTFVNKRVAIDYESNSPHIPCMHQQKQIPCITFMLTRLVKFTRKSDC